jgi:hypothetical protein
LRPSTRLIEFYPSNPLILAKENTFLMIYEQ